MNFTSRVPKVEGFFIEPKYEKEIKFEEVQSQSTCWIDFDFEESAPHKFENSFLILPSESIAVIKEEVELTTAEHSSAPNVKTETELTVDNLTSELNTDSNDNAHAFPQISALDSISTSASINADCFGLDVNVHLVKTEFACESIDSVFTSKEGLFPNDRKNNEVTFRLLEPKSELITYESEPTEETQEDQDVAKSVSTHNHNHSSQCNPYVLLKRLNSSEIERSVIKACPENSNSIQNQNQCKLCLRELDSSSKLMIHIGICALYHRDKDRFCVPCNTKFYKAQGLKKHNLRYHGTPQDKLQLYRFKCNLCPKRYQGKVELKDHLETHKDKKEQNRPFKCDSCERSFIVKDSFNKHLLTHSGDRPYRCEQPNCDKTFLNAGHLKDHLIIAHSQAKPFTCSEPNCGKSFNSRRGKINHETSHSDARPFACTEPNCGRTYKLKWILKDHLKTHTGLRPYKCTEVNCKKTFATSFSLYDHKRNVHRSK